MRHVQEVIAVRNYLLSDYTGIRYAIEVGGEDSKFLDIERNDLIMVCFFILLLSLFSLSTFHLILSSSLEHVMWRRYRCIPSVHVCKFCPGAISS